ncbi:TIM barrel protein [Halocella sp. SP3-1]|uniref:TIM barrel protein n=1 Tax=Halocella sp. SP3-1 TaxID=2382161 RepID=UPI000F752721|nr:TIM barrel protein [Halocella sp. SP3-1]AZO95902.1 hypothetical protein D7D81_15615 [Halocella sp. SP3-1]
MLNKNKIAGMNFNYAHYPLNYFLDSMVKLEIFNIELWGASPHLYVNDLCFADVKRIKKEIDIRNLNVICFTPEQCVYPINLSAKEDFIRERSIKYFEKSLEVSCELESPLLLITPGWGYRNEPISEAWLRCKESLSCLVARAEKRGIRLVLEPLTPQESNLINTVSPLKKMLSEINSPYLKAMLDTIPMALTGEDIEDYLNEFGEDLEHMHFIDGSPKGHLAWGDGVLPLDSYLKVINDYNYSGYMTLEITDRSYFLEPEAAVKKSIEQIMESL